MNAKTTPQADRWYSPQDKTSQTDDQRIRDVTPLPPPEHLIRFFPIAGTPVELSRREYMLLKSLMENAGRVQTRDSLESSLYSWGEEVASNALEVHIHHLRKKFFPELIRTVRGVGYLVDRQAS